MTYLKDQMLIYQFGVNWQHREDFFVTHDFFSTFWKPSEVELDFFRIYVE